MPRITCQYLSELEILEVKAFLSQHSMQVLCSIQFITFNSDMNQVGAIWWPLSLCKDAVDLNYVNNNIQTALYNAYLSVFNILTG